MNARFILTLALSLLAAAAIPGPCAYDPHPELDCFDDGVCPEGSVCGGDGFCKPISDDGCPAGGCPQGFVCDGAGGCLSDGSGCGACPEGFFCDGFTCVEVDGCLGGCPVGQSCVDRACVDDGDCPGGCPTGFLCLDGGCLADGPPCRHFLGEPDCVAGQVCAPRSLRLDSLDGFCVPAPPTTIPLGQPCVPAIGENACAGGFCAPTGPSAGICLAGCIGDGDCVNADEVCSEPFVGANGAVELCTPVCGDADECPSGMNACFVSRFQTSCLPENRSCAIALCDAEGCGGECTSGGECVGDDVCAPLQFSQPCGEEVDVQVCQGPAELNQPCDFVGGVQCVDGLACVPQPFVTTVSRGSCVEQSNTPVADGEVCAPVGGGNVCELGATCAVTNGGTPLEGVCLRFCDDDADCGGDLCRQAADFAFAGGSGTPQLAPYSMCVPACGFADPCPHTLRCDIETSTGCEGTGHCVARTNASSQPGPCVGNDDCSAGDVCFDGNCAATKFCP